MYAKEGIGSKEGQKGLAERESNEPPKQNFPAERRDIQYEAAERQVELLRPGVPVKPYSGFSKWRGGLNERLLFVGT